MSLLCCFPNWALHRIQHHYQHQEVLLGQRLAELQRQLHLMSSSLNSEYWLIAFFEQELTQQSRKLKQINRELKRRTTSSQELAI